MFKFHVSASCPLDVQGLSEVWEFGESNAEYKY
jgi:hypothetical protein